LFTKPNPAAVAYKLFNAYLISPSAVKIRASNPLASCLNYSASTTILSLFRTSSSVSLVNLTIAHRD